MTHVKKYDFEYKNMNFAEWITSELERRGWSRREAARRGGFSPSILDKVINGYSKPGLKFLEGLAKAFDMTLANIIEEKSLHQFIERAYKTAGITRDEALENDIAMTAEAIIRGYKFRETQEHALMLLEQLSIEEEKGDYRAKSAQHPTPSKS